jgi:hypothetical protein
MMSAKIGRSRDPRTRTCLAHEFESRKLELLLSLLITALISTLL